MANTFDISEFKTRLNDGTYKGAAGARRAVGRAPWSAKDKATAESLISSKFGGAESKAAAPKAPKTVKAAKKADPSETKRADVKKAAVKRSLSVPGKKSTKIPFTLKRVANEVKKPGKRLLKDGNNRLLTKDFHEVVHGAVAPLASHSQEDTYTLSVCHQSMDLLERVANRGVEVSPDSFSAINEVVCSVVNNLKKRAVSSILPSNAASEVASHDEDSEELPLHEEEDSIDIDSLSLRTRPPE